MKKSTRYAAYVIGSFSLSLPIVVGQHYVDGRVPTTYSSTGSADAGGGSLIHGDFDGDGRQDFMVTASFPEQALLIGGGEMGFSMTSWVSSEEHSPDVADLNGDGRADLLTRYQAHNGYYPGQVGLTFGSEVGPTFGSLVNIVNDYLNIKHRMKRAGDIDGDGDQDVVMAVSTAAYDQVGALRWFRNNGVGGFALAQSVTSTPAPSRFTLGDFDADGFLDAAAIAAGNTSASIFASTGTGFAAPQPIAALANDVGQLANGDVNADGIDDVVYIVSSTSLRWLRGSAGGLTVGGSQDLPGATGSFWDIRMADLDGDGTADAIFSEISSSSSRLWRSFGSAGSGLGAATSTVFPPAGSIDVFEYDNKPGLDLAYAGSSWPSFRPGDGVGGFIANSDYSAPGECVDSDSVCAGDIDHDGILDIAFESGSWLRGVGDGSFQAPAPLGARPSELLDLDGDGRLDAVSLLANCAAQDGLNVALSNATGFGPTTKPSQPTSSLVANFAFGDLDADGDLDLVTAGPSGTYSHLNEGSGSFAPFITTALPGPCSGIAVGDLNGDGFDDLACVGYKLTNSSGWEELKATLKFGLSTGNGDVTGIQSHQMFNLLFSAPTEQQVRIDDFNGDGYADMAATSNFTNVFVTLGDGIGGPANPQLSSSYVKVPESIPLLTFAIADMNGDGERDLIGGTTANGYLGIQRKNGPATFQTWRSIAVGPADARKILPYDFDADGQIDLAWGSGSSLRVALNRRDDAAGTVPFGTGTSGCLGRASLGAVQPARVGNGAFRVLANHLPPSAPGWFLMSTGNSPGGFDPFAVGALFHVDPLPPSTFTLLQMASDANGQASLDLPIPGTPLLAGYSVVIQTAHFGVGSPGFDCSTSPYSLVTSRGLTVTIQP